MQYCGPSFSVCDITASAHQWRHPALRQAFSLFNEIIERLAEGIRPYAEAILQLLPAVWQRAEGQPLLRIQACSPFLRCLRAREETLNPKTLFFIAFSNPSRISGWVAT